MSNPLKRGSKVRLSSKGQLVIPKRLRDVLSLREGDELVLTRTKAGLLIKRSREASAGLRGLLSGLITKDEEIRRLGEVRTVW